MNLVHRVTSSADPLPEAEQMAQRLLKRAPQSLGLVKRLLMAAADTDKSAVLFLESLAQSILIKTEDHQEGLHAFREKRKADFKGR